MEIASLRGQLGQHRAKAGELRLRLDTAPKVEAEFAQLNRDYDVNRAQYTALLANYEKAGWANAQTTQDPLHSKSCNLQRHPLLPCRHRDTLLIAILLGSLGLGGGLATCCTA